MKNNYLSPLPKPTVTPIAHEKWTGAMVGGILCNPIYTGIGPYSRVLSDEDWIRKAAKRIQEEGAEQFLVNMLVMLRASFSESA